MEKISALICTKNNEKNIATCINAIKGVDEIIIADGGSKDRTCEIAASLGAIIRRRHDRYDVPTDKDVDDFTNRFGWAPHFTTRHKIYRGEENQKKRLNYCKYDWVVGPDADEIITWDLPKIRKEILPIADQIESLFVHSHDKDGKPERITKIVKMFRRSVTKMGGRTHGAIIPNGRIVSIDFMRIDHWQIPNAIVNGKAIHSQSYVLPILEYSVLKDDDQRSRFYLGREYYYYHEYDRALTLFNLYLASATWQKEIAQAHLYSARCYWESMRGDMAREACLKAILINPDHKEALYLMSELYYEPWKSKWAYIAKNATDKDILF